jgi:hypothetical protein
MSMASVDSPITSAPRTTLERGLKANLVGGRPPEDRASPDGATKPVAISSSTLAVMVERPILVAIRARLGYEHGFTHQVIDLVSAIASGNPLRPNFADGLHVRRAGNSPTRHGMSDEPVRWSSVSQRAQRPQYTPCLAAHPMSDCRCHSIPRRRIPDRGMPPSRMPSTTRSC